MLTASVSTWGTGLHSKRRVSIFEVIDNSGAQSITAYYTVEESKTANAELGELAGIHGSSVSVVLKSINPIFYDS